MGLHIAEAIAMLLMLPLSMALYRQAVITHARVRAIGVAAIEGPEVGDLAPKLMRSSGSSTHHWLFAQETCTSTPALVELLASLDDADGAVTLVMQPRSSPISTQSVTNDEIGVYVLRTDNRPWLSVIGGNEAQQLDASLGIDSGPLYFRVVNGVIMDKHFVRSPDKLRQSLESGQAVLATTAVEQ